MFHRRGGARHAGDRAQSRRRPAASKTAAGGCWPRACGCRGYLILIINAAAAQKGRRARGNARYRLRQRELSTRYDFVSAAD